MTDLTPAPDVLISTTGLAKSYGSRWKAVEAVRGVDLQVRRGEIFGLVGPDGAGKTTTIQMLCGILRPSAGSATVAGVDVVASPDALGGRIGYMSEGFTLYGSLSVRENLDFFADLYRLPPDERETRLNDLLRFTRLEKVAAMIYRPCCNNPTLFPDCNHGMAMLGMLELMAAQGASEDEMLEAAKYVNAFWFPQQALETALYLKSTQDTDFSEADARLVVGKQLFSGSGFAQVHQRVQDSGLLGQAPGGASGCSN